METFLQTWLCHASHARRRRFYLGSLDLVAFWYGSEQRITSFRFHGGCCGWVRRLFPPVSYAERLARSRLSRARSVTFPCPVGPSRFESSRLSLLGFLTRPCPVGPSRF